MNANHRMGKLNKMLPQDKLDLENAKRLTLLPALTDSENHDEL
jgi:hypothetical protein